MIRRLGLATALLFALSPAAPAAAAVPHINHVFVIALENENASTTFGPDTEAPYLAQTLRSQGAFVPNYYGIGHESLDNYIAMVSGQAPNIETQADCQFFTEFFPGIPAAGGQYIGQGCVYPPGVETVANQLEDSGYTWKAYMEDMGSPCRHPAINARDNTQSARVGDQYAARHNPFVYFHSIIDFPTCAQNDVDYSQLATDLQQASTTADYSFITPNLCNDGHDAPCVDAQPGGLKQVDGWLRDNVPPILNSPAFQDRGLLIITFDEAEGEPPHGDASACCDEQAGFNTPNPGGPIPGPGGGRVGAVLLSPCTRPGTVTSVDYNHYSMLRSVERNFHLPYLGYARQSGLEPFGPDIFTRPSCRLPRRR